MFKMCEIDAFDFSKALMDLDSRGITSAFITPCGATTMCHKYQLNGHL